MSSSGHGAVDARTGYCATTKSFLSLRAPQPQPLPPADGPLTFPAFALSLLPSPLPAHPALLDAATGEAVSYPAFLSQVRALVGALRSRVVPLGRGDVAFVLAPARLDVPVLYFALLAVGVVVATANPALTAGERPWQERVDAAGHRGSVPVSDSDDPVLLRHDGAGEGGGGAAPELYREGGGAPCPAPEGEVEEGRREDSDRRPHVPHHGFLLHAQRAGAGVYHGCDDGGGRAGGVEGNAGGSAAVGGDGDHGGASRGAGDDKGRVPAFESGAGDLRRRPSAGIGGGAVPAAVPPRGSVHG
uniref:4-coumarate--CoA ligase-like protein 7 n=1 Tax=Aegilops tauschii TaxID=37682 RepID=M8ATB6_AEGTA